MLSKALFLSACLLGAATSLVSAGYSISAPGSGSTFKGGDQMTIKWTADGKNVEPKIDIRLVHGNADNLQYDFNLCSDVDPNDGQCTYTVSNDIASGIDYAVTAGKAPENFGYSSYFTIDAKGPLPENKGCPNMGGKNCPKSLPCCSTSGYCGSTPDYCNGCLAKYSFNGQCVVPGSSTDPTTSSTTPESTSSTTSTTTPQSASKPAPKPTPKPKKCGNKICNKKSPCCNKNKCGTKCGAGCKAANSFAGKCLKPKVKRDQF